MVRVGLRECVVGSVLAHALALAGCALAAVPLEASADEHVREPSSYQSYSFVTLAPEAPPYDPPRGSEPTRCGCDAAAGEPLSAIASGRYAVEGSADNPDPHIARRPAEGEAWAVAIAAAPAVWPGGDPAAPMAAWGRDDSLGTDGESARGRQLDGTIATAAGEAGLGGRTPSPQTGAEAPGGRKAVVLSALPPKVHTSSL